MNKTKKPYTEKQALISIEAILQMHEPFTDLDFYSIFNNYSNFKRKDLIRLLSDLNDQILIIGSIVHGLASDCCVGKGVRALEEVSKTVKEFLGEKEYNKLFKVKNDKN